MFFSNGFILQFGNYSVDKGSNKITLFISYTIKGRVVVMRKGTTSLENFVVFCNTDERIQGSFTINASTSTSINWICVGY